MLNQDLYPFFKKKKCKSRSADEAIWSGSMQFSTLIENTCLQLKCCRLTGLKFIKVYNIKLPSMQWVRHHIQSGNQWTCHINLLSGTRVISSLSFSTTHLPVFTYLLGLPPLISADIWRGWWLWEECITVFTTHLPVFTYLLGLPPSSLLTSGGVGGFEKKFSIPKRYLACLLDCCFILDMKI